MSNNLLDLIFKLLPAIIAFFLGFISNLVLTWRDKRNEMKNIRTILYKEMIENYKEIFRFFPKKETDELMSGSMFSAFSNLSTSVYDKYLDRLCKLKAEEINRIYNAYSKIRITVRINEEDRKLKPGELVDKVLQKRLFRDSKDVLESLDYALKLYGKWNDELTKLSKETSKRQS